MIQKLIFEKLPSTNTYAKDNIADLSLPTLIIANEQTAGRGRRGNSFFSPKDTGLYMTLVFKEKNISNLLTPAAAVSVCNSLSRLGLSPSIKWVNDIFISGKKVCGILTERFKYNENAYIALGIGINITTCNFPEGLDIAGSINTECDKNMLAEEISESILSFVDNPDEAEVINNYRSHLFIIGKKVSYVRNNIEFSGIVIDINEQCNLIIRHPDGKEAILSSGEISIIV